MHEVVESKLTEIRALCEKYHVRRLWLIGSALGDDFDPQRSDVDFVVEFGDVQRSGFDDVSIMLERALCDLLDRDVDLIEFPTVRNPYFRKEVEETRVPLYAA